MDKFCQLFTWCDDDNVVEVFPLLKTILFIIWTTLGIYGTRILWVPIKIVITPFIFGCATLWRTCSLIIFFHTLPRTPPPVIKNLSAGLIDADFTAIVKTFVFEEVVPFLTQTLFYRYVYIWKGVIIIFKIANLYCRTIVCVAGVVEYPDDRRIFTCFVWFVWLVAEFGTDSIAVI